MRKFEELEPNLQTNSLETGGGAFANDAGVRANLDLIGSCLDGAVENDNFLGRASDSGSELSVGRHCSCCSSSSSGSSSVLGSVTFGGR
jgi:hypothetical protein